MNTVEKNIVEKLISEKIVDNGFHASGMLNVLECVKLDTDEQRIARCKLYLAWQVYFEASKEFTSKTAAKKQARKNAIAGLAVPELPMLEPTHTEILEALADGG